VIFLFDFRKDKRLTQAEMASVIRVSYSLYQKIENGERRPTIKFIEKFKKVFPEVSADVFFSGGDAA